ncbi:hypothetical protein KM043_012255 [Ampulex compressa]|nr:hypothetical protein KM043_012255 [Ampulex compressa]
MNVCYNWGLFSLNKASERCANLKLCECRCNEMNPSKPRKSSSRRSSILKPPKPRQPLQNVNFNTSSNESSPATSKLKRRVSFAEKKHVKEFSNSVEQGTVWDNTYEENETHNYGTCFDACNNENDEKSNPKQNSPQASIPNVVCGDFENELGSTLDMTNPVESVALVNVQKIYFKPNTHDAKSIIPYEDTNTNEIEMHDCISTLTTTFSLLPSHNTMSSKNEKTMVFNKIQYDHDVSLESMGSEEFLKGDDSKKVLSYPLHGDKNSQMLHVDMMDSKNEGNQACSTKYMHNMELSVPLSDLVKPVIVHNIPRSFTDDDRTTIFQNVSMDITTAADGFNNSIDVHEPAKSRADITTVFHNDSMEITKPVKTTLSMNKSESNCQSDMSKVNISTEVTNTMEPILFKGKIMCLNEQSKLWDISMINTKSPKGALSSDQSKVIYQEDGTKIFHASMEMTNTIKSIPFEDKSVNEHTKSLNASMEITKPVKGALSIHEYKINDSDDRTKLFDTSIEVTNAINTIPLKDKTCLTDQTKLLNTSMEITEAINIGPYPMEINDLSMHSTSKCTNKNNVTENKNINIIRYPYNSAKEEVNNKESLMTCVTFLDQSVNALESIQPPSFLSFNESELQDSNSLHEVACNWKLQSWNNKEQMQEPTLAMDKCTASFQDVTHRTSPSGEYSNKTCDPITDQELSLTKSRKRQASGTFIIKRKHETFITEDINTHHTAPLEMYDMHNLQLTSTYNASGQGDILQCSSLLITGEHTDVSTNDNKSLCHRGPEVNDNCKRRYLNQGSESIIVEGNKPREEDMIIKEISHNIYTVKEIRNNMNISKHQEKVHPLIDQDLFTSLISRLKTHSEGDSIIWNVYDENASKMIVAIGFICNSLLAVIFLKQDKDYGDILLIKEIKIISRLDDDSNILMNIVHQLILNKIDVQKLRYMYKTEDDILPMLDNIAQEVKLAMNFMFDLKHLDDSNIMKITYDSLSFISRTTRMDIILKITMKIKPFDQIEPNDIDVNCLLGTIREKDVRDLIINVRKDHKFLRRYMNDVQDYIYLMEDSAMKKLY